MLYKLCTRIEQQNVRDVLRSMSKSGFHINGFTGFTYQRELFKMLLNRWIKVVFSRLKLVILPARKQEKVLTINRYRRLL